MDFSLNDEQQLLKESLERFLLSEYGFESRKQILASERGYSRRLWELYGEMGWLALPFAEADGSFGGGPVETMVLMEQFGRGLVLEPYLAGILLAGRTLALAGTEAQRAALLPGIMDGSRLATLAWIEPQARFDVANVTTVARARGNGWQIDGRKSVVLDAASADVIIVAARTSGEAREEHGVSLFALPADTAGIERRDYPTVDGFRASELSFREVSADEDALLGEPDQGLAILRTVIEEATLAVGAEAVGIMDVLLHKTVDYSRERVQFGVPIGSFQALQHRMVDMLISLQQARSLLYMAVMRAEQEQPEESRRAVSALKYYIGGEGRALGEEAVQIHGGMGVTDELDVSHYFKRLTMIDTLFGNADHHLERFASLHRA